MVELLIPAHLKKARKSISVVFYYHRQLNRIMVGFPENYPVLAPHGFEKIVCRTAAEVDTWSARLRLQEKCDDEMTDEHREAVEGPIRAYVRQELTSKMMNSRNEINREFCRQALRHIDEQEAKSKMKKTSFMHIEGFTEGH